MKPYRIILATSVLLSFFLASCGQSSEQPEPTDDTIEQQSSVDDTLQKIVSATCSDLRNASSQADAAQTLSYSMQLADSIGVSNTQLGSLLSSACQDALNYANQLP